MKELGINNCIIWLRLCHKLLITAVITVKNQVVRIVKSLPWRAHVSAARVELHWLPVFERIIYKLVSLVYSTLVTKELEYIADLLTNYVPALCVWSMHDKSRMLFHLCTLSWSKVLLVLLVLLHGMTFRKLYANVTLWIHLKMLWKSICLLGRYWWLIDWLIADNSCIELFVTPPNPCFLGSGRVNKCSILLLLLLKPCKLNYIEVGHNFVKFSTVHRCNSIMLHFIF